MVVSKPFNISLLLEYIFYNFFGMHKRHSQHLGLGLWLGYTMIDRLSIHIQYRKPSALLVICFMYCSCIRDLNNACLAMVCDLNTTMLLIINVFNGVCVCVCARVRACMYVYIYLLLIILYFSHPNVKEKTGGE